MTSEGIQPPESPSTPQKSVSASGIDPETMMGAIALAVLIGLIVAITLMGWVLFFRIVLTCLVAIATCMALFCLAKASDEKDEETKSAYWIGCGVSVAAAFVAWLLIPAPEHREGESSVQPAGAENLSGQGDRTLRYWNQLNAVCAEMVSDSKTGNDVIRDLKSASSRMAVIPTAGVDIEAVQCGNSLREWLMMVVAEAERRNSAEFAVETFARGFQGDFAGPVSEYTRTNSRIKAFGNETLSRLVSTRALLSARYGVEFPLIQ